MKLRPCDGCHTDILVFDATVYEDERGLFYESYNQEKFDALVGQHIDFVQDNVSHSVKNVLRGLHYQIEPAAQGKLVRCSAGTVWDVALDLRPESPRYLKYFSCVLSGENHASMWIPAGHAHGFVVISDWAIFNYKTTDYYRPELSRTLRWNDPAFDIPWPVQNPIVNQRDSEAALWA